MKFLPVIRSLETGLFSDQNSLPSVLVETMQWGLVEFGPNLIINARFDEVKEKRLFKSRVETARCVVMADGYYEWMPNAVGSQNKSGTIPHYISLSGGRALLLAALYFFIPGSAEAAVQSGNCHKVVLMTQPSNLVPKLKSIHHRMPVVLDSTTFPMWLQTEKHSFSECETAIDKSKICLEMQPFEVSDHVNDRKNTDSACIKPRKEF